MLRGFIDLRGILRPIERNPSTQLSSAQILTPLTNLNPERMRYQAGRETGLAASDLAGRADGHTNHRFIAVPLLAAVPAVAKVSLP